MGQLAAPLAVKTLQGTPAGTIPLVTPEQNLYVITKWRKNWGCRYLKVY